ncbi:MAG TPA: DUF4337 domain-containing protein [Bacteroidota bacterium]|nr:DUF4337 domain-containing protein [Bacteroidota bacterium]
MPEDPEVPTEHLHEAIHEEAEKGASWVMAVALSTAVLAVLAAITALLAGNHANEAMMDQIQASDQWAFYQAKGIKAAVLESKSELLKGLGKEPAAGDEEKLEKYKSDQKEIQAVAEEKTHASEAHLARHETLAKGVTVFQVSIAIAAIAVLTRRRWMWFTSMLLGLCGCVFLVLGII